MSRTAWNTSKVTPAPTGVSFAHLMLQEMENQKAQKQEQADFKLALSLQEPLAPQHPDNNNDDFDDVLAQALAESSSSAQAEDPDAVLARQLQAEFDAADSQGSRGKKGKGKGKGKISVPSVNEDDDYLMALKMQAEFDKDFNKHLSAVERQQNAGSKVQVSLKNYRLAEYPENDEDEIDEEFYNAGEDFSDAAISGINTGRGPASAGPKKTSLSPKKKVTKHDLDADGIKNARRMDKLPVLDIGNSGKVKDLRLPYKVFNSLKNHASRASGRENARNKTRLFDKDDYSTQDSVMDKRTRILLLQLVNKEIIEEVDGIINTGKEANVYYATAIDNWVDAVDDEEGDQPKGQSKKRRQQRRQSDEDDEDDEGDDEDEGEEYTVSECAMKIFKTTLQEFKNREEYIREDSRYANRLAKHNSRKLIKLWAEKEMLNLGRMNRAGIQCPEVLHHEEHILVLSFLGKDKKAAPTLKEAGRLLSPGRREELYEQCIKGMRTMYQVARLVHADLSEYNLVYHNQSLWFIDVSQAVEKEHPNAHTFLFRDCCNVTKYFRSIGVDGAMSPLELFSFVISDSLASSIDDEALTAELQQFVQARLGEGVEVSVHDPTLQEVLNKLLPSYLEEDALKQLGDPSSDSEESEDLSE